MKTLVALANTGTLIFDPIDLVIDYAYDISDRACQVLEDKLWTLLENLKRTYRFLKSKSVRGWKELLEATNRLSDFLHQDKLLDHSRLSKLLKILSVLNGILTAALLINTIYANGPLVITLTMLNVAMSIVIAFLQKRLYEGSFSAEGTF